jgi:hypothetical protein
VSNPIKKIQTQYKSSIDLIIKKEKEADPIIIKKEKEADPIIAHT